MTHHLRLLLLSASFFMSTLWAQETPPIGPSPESTLLLEYTNRFRMNPKAEAQAIVDFLKKYRGKNIEYLAMWNGTAQGNGLIRTFRPRIDFKMFQEEMAKIPATPPLVFNLQLINSAYNHSKYMKVNDIQSHSEAKDKKAFTGLSVFHRTRAAKYPGSLVGENVFLHGKNPWYCHLGFLIDWGPGPGGMQPARGHRVNMARAIFKEIGIATIKYRWRRFHEISATQNFGIVSKKNRFIGGVIYNDKNKNNFYDIGEGIGDVLIKASDGSTCKSWPSGAYTLKLKSNLAVTITTEYFGLSNKTKLKQGYDNSKLDWKVPAKEKIQQLQLKLDLVEEKPTSKNFLTDLYIASREGLILNESSNLKITNHLKETKITLDPIFDKLHQLLKEQDIKKLNLFCSKTKRKYQKTDFTKVFNELDLLKSATKRFLIIENRVLKTSNKRTLHRLKSQAKKNLKKLRETKQKLFYLEFLPHWDHLIKETRSLPF